MSLSTLEQLQQILPRQHAYVLRSLKEWADVGDDAILFYGRNAVCDETSPVGDLFIRQLHAGLSQRGLKHREVRLRPRWIAQIPYEVIHVASFDVRSMDEGMEFPGEKTRLVVVQQVQQDVTANE